MKINSKTKYNKPSEYHPGDKVRLVTIDEAVRRARHINNISINYDDHVIVIKVDGEEKALCSVQRYEDFLSFDELTVTSCDLNDKIHQLLLTSINDNEIWMHPVFLDKV